MTENNDKKEIVYHPATREFDNTKNLITNIGFETGSDEKYEILWPIPSRRTAASNDRPVLP